MERDEIPRASARRAAVKLIEDPKFTIDQAFKMSGEQVDFEHSIEQLADRLSNQIDEHVSRGYQVGQGLRRSLRSLTKKINSFTR